MTDSIFEEIGCVIMASGMGKRFGGNKLLEDFCGKPLIQWILDTSEGIFPARIVVTRHPEVEALCRAQSIPVILHSYPGRNDTVRLGLKKLLYNRKIQNCMFCPSDQPLLKRKTILSLAEQAAEEKEKIWRLYFHETPGAPVIFPSWTFQELCTLPEGKGGGVLLKKYPDAVKMVEASDFYELKDIDTREDLEVLSRFTLL